MATIAVHTSDIPAGTSGRSNETRSPCLGRGWLHECRPLNQTGPRRSQDRGAARPLRLAGRARPPGRLQPARRMGANARPRRAHPDGCRRPTTAGHFQPPGLPVLVRNELFRRVELASLRHYRELGDIEGSGGWTADRWRQALEPYFAQHTFLGTGPDARGPQMLIVDKDSGFVAGPADPRRPRWRPQLGHIRHRRSRRLRRRWPRRGRAEQTGGWLSQSGW